MSSKSSQAIKSKLFRRDVSNHSSLIKNREDAALFVYLMIKLTVLTVVAIVSSWMFVVLGMWRVAPVAWQLDCFVNTLSLTLSFKHFDGWYRRLCWVCRGCCEYPIFGYLNLSKVKQAALVIASAAQDEFVDAGSSVKK